MSRLTTRRKRIAQGATLGLVGTTLAVLAIQYEGSPIRDVDLNDGGVWVTNANQQMMARLNSQAKELEMGILTSQGSNAVFQEGASVQVFDAGDGQPGSTLRLTDPVSGTAKPLELPGTVAASAARGTVGLVDAKSGKVWIKRADQLGDAPTQLPADLEVAPRSTLVVAHDGAALVADRSTGVVTSWRLDAAGKAVEQDSWDFEREFHDGFRLTAVGGEPVVLQEGELLLPGGDEVAVPGKSPVLQEVGPRAEAAYVATSGGLFRVDLEDHELTRASELKPGGAPAAPVVVDGCVYAAWAAPHTPNYQRTCGDDDPVTGEVKPMAQASDLVFRSNRDVVVLNDTANGNAWMVQDGMTLVDNWPSVNPNAADPQVAKASDQKQTNKKNKPPTAKPDKFGARAGSTVLLPVTLNDIDPDGDILTVSEQLASAKSAELSVAGDGTRVQARVGSGAKSFEFEYEVSDGQPGHDADKGSRAKVSVTVYGPGTDKKPHLIEGQKNALTVASGHEASTNVLAGWIDPEGDPLVLTGASGKGGQVTFRPDGTITFVDDGKGPGHERIDFTAQGGQAEAKGVLEVTVVAPAKATPVAVADRFAGPVGTSILLKPLANDTDPLGKQLTIPRLTVKGGGAEAQRNPDGTATFRAERSGAYFLDYTAASSNGRQSEQTTIRVDVWPRSDDNQSPVATRDLAALRQDGTALVDVLANDTDPDGDVLVLQGVEVPPRWADQITASVVNKRFVRVQARGEIEGDPEFEYLVSDGVSDQAEGTVAVVTAPAAPNRPPSAVDDQFTVRAGSIVTLPVLANDEDRDGDRLFVYQPDLHDVSGRTWITDQEVPFIATGSGIRVQVPDQPDLREMTIGYGVRDEHHARSDARLVINIRPDDKASNQAPEPRPVEDRTVVGQKVRVPVDVFGADPDGDPVVFTGVETAPTLGRISATGASWFEYEPFEDTRKLGTDTFDVRVSDKYGATGLATVRIGVAPRSLENQPPAALDDEILVKPGRTIQYPVLQNDSDPDGDPLLVEDDQFQVPRNATAALKGEVVEIDVPELGKRSEATATARYAITDGLGMSSAAVLTVTAREDAPNHAPLAQDDVVPAEEMAGKAAGDTVDVDVLENDGDLDGARSELELQTAASGSEVVDGKLRVTLKRTGQTVPYRITDATDESSFGFVYVAGTDTMVPMVNQAAVPIESKAGETTTVDLDDVTIVRPGRDARIGRLDTIETANGDTKAAGDTSFSFHAPKDFHGPASVTMDVIDGTGLNDPTGLKANLTYPITVLPSGNVPPEVRDTAVLVYAGGDSRSIQLDRLARDLNKDELSFEVGDAQDGVRAGVSDDILEISAEDGARTGEQVLEVEVSDGKADPVVAHVRVQVIGSSGAGADTSGKQAPPMQLTEIRIADGKAGETETVDVRDAIVFDPFPGKDKQIESLSASGPASASKAGGTSVKITPSGDGEVVVTYSLSDGSGDVNRAVQGRIVVVVADVPDAPGAPAAAEGGPDSVLLTWRAPSDNGSPIEKYVVRSSKGGEQECTGTQCTIEGLDPGKKYTFTVAAVNGVGEGPQSPASGPITPDTVPEVMTAPVIDSSFAERDRQLHLRWTEAESKGSEVLAYEIRLSPGADVRKVSATRRDYLWTGLQNGTEYRFEIRALNARGEGPWSSLSDGQVPFTKPQPMTAPTVVAAGNDDRANAGYVEVSWSSVQPPQDGYDAVASYEIELIKDGVAQQTVTAPGTATMRAFDVENGHEYRAKVRAVNRAGEGEWSGASAPVNTWDRAAAPTNVRKVSDCDGCGAQTDTYFAIVGFTPPSDTGGYPVVSYNWRTSDGASGNFAAPSGNQARIRFRTATQGQDVWLTAVTNPPGATGTTGAESGPGGGFNPYAKPFQPTATKIEGYRQAGFRLSCDGNGRPVQYLDWRWPDTAERGRMECSPTATKVWSPIEGGHGRYVVSEIRTVAGDSGGRGSGLAVADPPTVDISFRSKASSGECSAPCYAVYLSVGGYIQGHLDYRLRFVNDGSPGIRCSTTEVNEAQILSADSSGHDTINTSGWVSGTCGTNYKVEATVWGNKPTLDGTYNSTTVRTSIP